MALYHIHKSGKHVNKKAADNFKNQNQKLWKNWNEVLAAQLKIQTLKDRRFLCRNLCFSN